MNEAVAAGYFLKAFETQEAYSLLYQAFDRFYQRAAATLPLPEDTRGRGTLFLSRAISIGPQIPV